MKALIVNDDGIDSAGLASLPRVAVDAGLDVSVAAPHLERSGASASLSALEEDGTLSMSRRELPGPPDLEFFSVECSPALISLLAAEGVFGRPPDIVLSGVDLGPNTGHAILYSGTVGAALTAAGHGARAVALSLDGTAPSMGDSGIGCLSCCAPGNRACSSGTSTQREYSGCPSRRTAWTPDCSPCGIRCRASRNR